MKWFVPLCALLLTGCAHRHQAPAAFGPTCPDFSKPIQFAAKCVVQGGDCERQIQQAGLVCELTDPKTGQRTGMIFPAQKTNPYINVDGCDEDDVCPDKPAKKHKKDRD